MVHNKTQQRTLSVLRQLLRIVRATVDSRAAADASVRDVSSWHGHLMSEYRRCAGAMGRAELKALRATADDTLAYLNALGEHRDLLERYRGGDPDSERLRRSAARYVGLEMPPEGAPLPASTGQAAVVERYAAPLAGRAGSDASGLTGLDHLKAQLYGADWREVDRGGAGGISTVGAGDAAPGGDPVGGVGGAGGSGHGGVVVGAFVPLAPGRGGQTARTDSEAPAGGASSG